MSQSIRQRLLRKIPSVDEILSRKETLELLKIYPRSVVVDSIRIGLNRLREEILKREDPSDLDESILSQENLNSIFQREIEFQVRPTLRRVINATGVVIHTNLGRAPLHSSAISHMIEVSRTYSNLEYDLDIGERGDRHSHVENILCRLSGSESAMVVNNNAGAVLLALNTIAEGKEVIVSRGEMVEIGGSFRIPDVMKRSGAILKEVGTTNRTHLSDYKNAIGPQTALLLKVHRSNFRILGFTSEVTLKELVQMGKQYSIPVLNDLGSGCFIDLGQYGLEKEPTVQESINSGVDLVTFSGDKLLGGPQAGIIVGKKRLIDLMKINPLSRALRIDKLTLAALESTLLLYLDEKRAVNEIPVLRMLSLDRKKLTERAKRLLKRLPEKIKREAKINLREDFSQVGGGALPLQELKTIVISIKPQSISINKLEKTLRMGDPPIISRISKDELILDMRTIFDDEIPLIATGIEEALTKNVG